jgi:hypothetical protein
VVDAIVGDVDGKNVIVLDDEIARAGPSSKLAEAPQAPRDDRSRLHAWALWGRRSNDCRPGRPPEISPTNMSADKRTPTDSALGHAAACRAVRCILGGRVTAVRRLSGVVLAIFSVDAQIYD